MDRSIPRLPYLGGSAVGIRRPLLESSLALIAAGVELTVAERHLIPPSHLPRAPLERAIEEIRQAEAISAATRRRELRSRSMVAQLDHLVEELEMLHLKGGQRVPNSMAARLQQFLDQLPPQCRRAFPLRTRIAYVLDDLFKVQDLLLNLAVTGRAALAADDLDLDADDEAEMLRPSPTFGSQPPEDRDHP